MSQTLFAQYVSWPDRLVSEYHLHPIVDHFTIALLAVGIGAEILACVTTALSRGEADWLSAWTQKLRSTSLVLMIGGATAAVLSCLTGDIEADRLWDTMSKSAQQILASSDGTASHLSHAVLGWYLMRAFLVLAGWRVLIEYSTRFRRLRGAFLIAATVAVGMLFYQGKTGGELVYDCGVGRPKAASARNREQEGFPETPSLQEGRKVGLEVARPTAQTRVFF